MKRIITSMLCIAVVLSFAICPAMASQIVTGDFSSAFESLSNSVSQINYSITEGGGWALTAAQTADNYIDVVSDDSQQGEYLDVVGATNSALALRYYPIDDIETTVDIKIDLKLDDRNAERRLIWYDSEGHNSRVGVISKSNGKFTLFGVSNVAVFDLDVWYEIHIKYNFETNYYIWTIRNKATDSTESREGFYTDHSLVNLDHIRYFVPNSCNGISHLYLDNLGVNKITPLHKDFMSESDFTLSKDLSGYSITSPDDVTLSSEGLTLTTSSVSELGIKKDFDIEMYGKYRFETVLGKFSGEGRSAIKLGTDEVVAFDGGNIYCGANVIGTYSDDEFYKIVIITDTSDKTVGVWVSADNSESDFESIEGITALTAVPLSNISICVIPASEAASAVTVRSLGCYSGYGMDIISSDPENGSVNINPVDIKLTFTNPILTIDNLTIGDYPIDYVINENKRNEVTLLSSSVFEYGTEYEIIFDVTDIFGNQNICSLSYTTKPVYEIGDITLTESGASISGKSNDGFTYDFDLIVAEFDSESGKLLSLKKSLVSLGDTFEEFETPIEYNDGSYYEAYLWDSIFAMGSIKESVSLGTAPNLTKDSSANGFKEDMDTGIMSASGFGFDNPGATFMVLRPGKTLDDLSGASELTDVICYIAQYDNLTEDLISFAFSGNGGKYGVAINSANSLNFISEAFEFVDVEYVQSVYDAINAETLDIAKIVASYNDVLTVDDKHLSSLSEKQNDALNLLVAKGREAHSDGKFNSFKEFSACYYSSLCEVMIRYAKSSEDVKAVFTDYSQYIALNGFKVYPTYLELSQPAKENVYLRIANNGIEKLSDLEVVFNDSAILAAVKFAKYQQDIGKIISDNKEYLNWDLKDYNSLRNTGKVHSALLGKDYDTVEELSEAFDKAVSKQKDAEKEDSKKPSTGGGSSGSSYGGKTVILPPVEQNENEPSVETKVSFNDTSSYEWAKDAINYLASKNIISGKADGVFAPGDYITREEFAKIAVLAFAPSANASDNAFTDVHDDAWYSDYISKAVSSGLVNGLGDGSFGVGSSITRQDIALVLYRAASLNGIKLNTKEILFADANDISSYAYDAVSNLYGSGIINGTPAGNFNPKAFATRAEAAKMIYEILKIGGNI